MKPEKISETIGNISNRHIQEAANYTPAKKKNHPLRKTLRKSIAVAAIIVCMLVAYIGVFPFFGGAVVKAYAQGTDEEITAAGANINTGRISDSGEMVGHPLMFYLSGKDIVDVRFSCKNQQIYFMDWTEKRDEYGLAQNFTVSYGSDASEYYYLLIDWVPNQTIRTLIDNSDVTIATLPPEMREDVIVMEINFSNGKTATKSITISLLDGGTFFATFDDYIITEQDSFVNRPDAKAIPRDVLYAADNP